MKACLKLGLFIAIKHELGGENVTSRPTAINLHFNASTSSNENMIRKINTEMCSAKLDTVISIRVTFNNWRKVH